MYVRNINHDVEQLFFSRKRERGERMPPTVRDNPVDHISKKIMLRLIGKRIQASGRCS